MINVDEKQELINAAKECVEDIIAAINRSNKIKDHYPSFYVSENGYTASAIRTNMRTRTCSINFGYCLPNKKSVLEYIQHEQDELNELIRLDKCYHLF